MNKAIIIHEFKMMMKTKKNYLFVIALISLLLTYCFLILPVMETDDSFEAEPMKTDVKNIEAVQQGMIDRDGTGFGNMTGTQDGLEINQLRLKVHELDNAGIPDHLITSKEDILKEDALLHYR